MDMTVVPLPCPDQHPPDLIDTRHDCGSALPVDPRYALTFRHPYRPIQDLFPSGSCLPFRLVLDSRPLLFSALFPRLIRLDSVHSSGSTHLPPLWPSTHVHSVPQPLGACLLNGIGQHPLVCAATNTFRLAPSSLIIRRPTLYAASPSCNTRLSVLRLQRHLYIRRSYSLLFGLDASTHGRRLSCTLGAPAFGGVLIEWQRPAPARACCDKQTNTLRPAPLVRPSFRRPSSIDRRCHTFVCLFLAASSTNTLSVFWRRQHYDGTALVHTAPFPRHSGTTRRVSGFWFLLFWCLREVAAEDFCGFAVYGVQSGGVAVLSVSSRQF
ncbi:uncharacterized protein J3D65DRAFT_362901 [Phyllosticta citribraziliensis]|uniref:Uncharacterized protein n=1 Tax=Phyllosticta citribraziliensis TaxID=989973 RepID=A0ABR1LPF2_9PEZI